MTAEDAAQAKRRAADAAVDEIADGMLGGRARHRIDGGAGHRGAGQARRCGPAHRGGRNLAGDRAACTCGGIAILPFDDIARIDLAIDGADEVDPALRAIKGAGGALLREKIVAQAADRMFCIVDAGKLVARLGARPVPVEILPFARAFVTQAVQALGGDPALRLADGRPVTSDQGNLLLDCHFGAIDDPERLAAQLQAIPGLLAHGLFLVEIDLLLVGDGTGVTRRARG